MGVFDYFWEIPEFRRSFHVFNFVGVVGCFHVLELLCCLFENLVLTIFSGEHTLPDYGVFNVLVNCFIDMPEHFCAGLEYFLMFVITVIGPQPIPAIPLSLLIFEPLLLGLPLLFLLGSLSKILTDCTFSNTLIFNLLLFLWLLNGDWWLFQLILLLSIEYESHPLDGSKGHQPRNANLHGVGILLEHKLFGEGISFLDDPQSFSYKVNLVPFEFVPKKPICDQFFFQQDCEVFDEMLISLQRNFPEVYASGEKRGQASFHLLQGFSQGIDIKFLDFCQVFVFENFENNSDIRSVFNWFRVMFVQNFNTCLQALAVSVNVSFIFEAVYDFFLASFIFEVIHNQLHIYFKEVYQRLKNLHKFLLVDQLKRLFKMRLHEFEEFSICLLQVSLRFSIRSLIQTLQIIKHIVDSLNEDLSEVVLGVCLDIFMFTEHPIEIAIGWFLLFLLSEVDAPDPLMLNPLEGWLDLHHGCHLVEQIPEHLELP